MPNDVKAMEMKAREMLAAAYAPERFTVCNNEVPNGFINRRDQAALRAIVAAMEGAWEGIESAPKDGRFILLHVPHGLESGTVTVGGYYKCDERDENGRFVKGNWDGWLGMDADIASSWCEPTHWRPLPAPPSTIDGGKG